MYECSLEKCSHFEQCMCGCNTNKKTTTKSRPHNCLMLWLLYQSMTFCILINKLISILYRNYRICKQSRYILSYPNKN